MRIIFASLILASMVSVMSASAASLLPVPTSTPTSIPNIVTVASTVIDPTVTTTVGTSTIDSSWIALGQSGSQAPVIGMANPASLKCVQDGGKLRTVASKEYCVFQKPFQMVEEWAYFRAEVARTR